MHNKFIYANSSVYDLKQNKGFLNFWATQIKKDVRRTNLLDKANHEDIKTVLGEPLFKIVTILYWKYTFKNQTYYLSHDGRSRPSSLLIQLVFWGSEDEYLENPVVGLEGTLMTQELIDHIKLKTEEDKNG